MIMVIKIFCFYVYPVFAIAAMVGLAVCLILNRNTVLKF